MIIGNESDPMNFLILLIETRPCNFIDLESLLNNAIFAIKKTVLRLILFCRDGISKEPEDSWHPAVSQICSC